jgi:hypothetical protein
MHGSATCTAPASAGASTTPRPARGERHLWVPRDLGNAALLLALVLDGDRWPNNATGTAKLLGVTHEAIRLWRGWLVAAGLLVVDGAHLVATEAGRACLERSDPLPRALLRGERPTPKVLRACAAVYGECIGWRADRRGVRADAERADALCIGRATVAEARRLLAARGLVKLEKVQRGRARLVRPRAQLDAKGKPVGAHGSPLCELARQRLAVAAERGRRGANGSSSEGANGSSSPHQEASLPCPIGRDAPAGTDGAATPAAKDGQASNGNDAANAVSKLAQVAQAGGDVLAELARQRAEQNPQRQAEQAKDREASTRRQAERLLADGLRLERAVADGRTADLLAAFGVFDRCERVPQHKAAPLLDRRRQGLAVRLAKTAGSTSRAALVVVQVAAAALRWRKLRSLGALVAKRLERFIADANLVAVAGPWATLDARAVVAVFRGERPAPRGRGERRSDAAPIAKDHAEHPAMRALRSRIIGAAQAGDWRALLRALNEPIAREQGLGARAASDWSGVPEADIEAGLAAAREAAAARFAAARRATA